MQDMLSMVLPLDGSKESCAAKPVAALKSTMSAHHTAIISKNAIPHVATVSAHHTAIISKNAILLLIICKSDMFSKEVPVFLKPVTD